MAQQRRTLAAFISAVVLAELLLLSRAPSAAHTPPPAASPLAGPSCGDAATPIPSPVSSPVAVDPTALLLRALVDRLAACWNAQEWGSYAALLSPEARTARFGTADPTVIADHMSALAARNLVAPMTIDSAQYAREMSEGTALIQVRWRQGYAEFHHSWIFVRTAGTWRLDNLLPLEQPLDGPAVGLRVVLDDQGIAVPRDEIASTEFVMLQAVNETGGSFAFDVFGYPADAEPAALIGGSPVPGAFAVADVVVASEETVDLVLQGLPPGSYLLTIGLDGALAANDPALLRAVRFQVSPASPTG